VNDQAAPDFSFKPTLTGDKVVLRPFDLGRDADALREMLQDAEGQKLTGSTGSTDEKPEWAESQFWAWYSTRNHQPDRLDLAVIDKASGQCVGEVVLNDWNAANRSCGFRTILGPAGRDRGLGTEAVRMIIGYGFEQLGMHRIELQVYSFNPRARRVYDKVGFVAEGVLRDALRWDDRWIDAIVMSMLDHEWLRHRGYPLAASP
jgi:RimJ/RimL family protein N-acetyltransferase